MLQVPLGYSFVMRLSVNRCRYILLLESTKISEQNLDSISSFNMLSSWCLKVREFGFEIISIDEHDHWHYSNSSYFM